MITMKEAINKVVKGNDLTLEEAKEVMNLLLSGEATQAQIGSFLTALVIKGETIDEITGCATVMQDKADHVKPNVGIYADLVGTGGDCTNTFNISTTAAFVAVGAGAKIAKHGNRAISSRSGAADVLEELGVTITLEAPEVEKCVEEVGIGFMFAQTFNKSMKYVSQARKDMGIRTIFNILGPLSNPSGAKACVIGVFSEELTEPMAGALMAMGVEHGFVVHGLDGMDEITTTAQTRISEIKDGKVTTYNLNPADYGIKTASPEDLKGGDCTANAVITKDILTGKDKGPKRDIVVLNAAATLYVCDVADSIEKGIEMAQKSIDDGSAMNVLNNLINFNK